MSRFELYPNFKLSLHRKDDEDVEYYNNRYMEQRVKALQKCKYKCIYCGLEVIPDKNADSRSLLASGYLEIHHMDNNHQNNNLNNLYAVCPFCHSVIHLGFTALSKRCYLAYLPEISQERINLISSLCGVGLVAHQKTRDILEASLKMSQLFAKAGLLFTKRYNFTTSEFISVLIDKQKENKIDEIKKVFKSIKVIPVLSSYNQEMFLYWAKGMKADISYWEKFYLEHIKRI